MDQTNQTIAERLATLRSEFEKGQQRLAHLDNQRHEVRDTLLRISGAIQVLEELLRANEVEEPEARAITPGL